MQITIVGAGNGGTAAAGSLAYRGFDVNLLEVGYIPRPDHFNILQETNELKMKGMYGEHIVKLNKVTKNPEDVIPSSDIILVYYVTNYHRIPAKAIAKYLRDDQIIYVCPGYLGSLIFLDEMKKIGNNSKVIFAEGETLPNSARILSPGVVNITSGNFRNPVAVYPKERSQFLSIQLGKIIKNVAIKDSLIEVALHNPNLLIHTIGVLMNMSRVEDPQQNFSMYRVGFSESIWKVVKALDNEKMEILKEVGAKPQTYFEAFSLRTFENFNEIEPLQGFQMYANTSSYGPFTVNNRYITEDVPMGLGLLSYLGKQLGIETPVADMLIKIASIVLDRNFFLESRTCKDYGFDNFYDFYCFIK